MPYFGQDYVQPFPSGDGLRDYTHASKTFKSDGYSLAPRNKFLFYVYFNVNLNIPALANLFSGGKLSTLGLTVKTAQLPSYQIDVTTMNQYNRKRLVQTKLNYNPAQIVFNDDSGDLIRNMWYQYYQYYYSDPTYKYGNTPNQSGTLGTISTALSGFSYGSNDTYAANRPVQHWGLSGQGYNNPTIQSLGNSILTGPASGQEPFFNDITIYGMSRKTFAQYTMVNPLITEWQHDTYDYSQGNGIMTNTMTIKYETVKYYSGAVGGSHPSGAVTGFADPAHYDTTPSPITPLGGTATSPGQGQIQPSSSGSIQDLQALATGQNGLSNLLGAVGQALVPAASSFVNDVLGRAGSLAVPLQIGASAALNSIRNPTQIQNSNRGTIQPAPAGVDVATKLRNLRAGR